MAEAGGRYAVDGVDEGGERGSEGRRSDGGDGEAGGGAAATTDGDASGGAADDGASDASSAAPLARVVKELPPGRTMLLGDRMCGGSTGGGCIGSLARGLNDADLAMERKWPNVACLALCLLLFFVGIAMHVGETRVTQAPLMMLSVCCFDPDPNSTACLSPYRSVATLSDCPAPFAGPRNASAKAAAVPSTQLFAFNVRDLTERVNYNPMLLCPWGATCSADMTITHGGRGLLTVKSLVAESPLISAPDALRDPSVAAANETQPQGRGVDTPIVNGAAAGFTRVRIDDALRGRTVLGDVQPLCGIEGSVTDAHYQRRRFDLDVSIDTSDSSSEAVDPAADVVVVRVSRASMRDASDAATLSATGFPVHGPILSLAYKPAWGVFLWGAVFNFVGFFGGILFAMRSCVLVLEGK